MTRSLARAGNSPGNASISDRDAGKFQQFNFRYDDQLEFPIEPHVLTPFIHWLPRRLQARLLRNFTVWGLMTRPDAAARARFLDTTRMLTRTELQTLFPGAEIWTERFLGLAKSFVAVKIDA